MNQKELRRENVYRPELIPVSWKQGEDEEILEVFVGV